MKNSQKKWWNWLSLVVVACMLAACAAPASQAAPAVTVVEKEIKVIETKIVEGTPQVVERIVTATPVTPQVGGKMVLTLYTDPPSLDQQVVNGTLGADVAMRYGATLLTYDLESGALVGYLAESWSNSPDGLELTFKLKSGVKFHNGEPLTAQDFVYTFERSQDPNFANLAKDMFASVSKVEAVDDLTVKFVLSAPSYSFLDNLASTSTQPVNKKAVEAAGDGYGKSPVGVGPFIFKEWVTGEKIVLERNPDFNWGPAYAHQGPAYIQELEFRILPEPATIIAGLEAGEIDFSEVYASDISRYENSDKYVIWQAPMLGIYPYVAFNYSVPPLDDVRFRQALSYATDKESIIKVVAQGRAVVQWGPLSDGMSGYWPGVEYIGLGYDLPKAQALMADLGYTLNADGMLEKDGEPFKLTVKADSTDPNAMKTAEVLKEQYKALGVDLEIQLEEMGVFYDDLLGKNNFEIGLPGLGWPNDDLLWMMFHKDGPVNMGKYTNDELSAQLDTLRSTVDTEAHLKLSAEIQKFAVENALVIPTFTMLQYLVYGSRVKDVTFKAGGDPRYAAEFFDAYIP